MDYRSGHKNYDLPEQQHAKFIDQNNIVYTKLYKKKCVIGLSDTEYWYIMKKKDVWHEKIF